jgi:curved DNA-binding protein CbpA
MAEINEAYAVLSDPNQRREYDNLCGTHTQSSDSYFGDNTNNEVPPIYDPLEKDWNIALKYYKDLYDLESRLSKISWRLGYTFRAYVLEEKAFNDRQKIAESMEFKFLKIYFGENQKIVDFARYLIGVGNKLAAKSLNEAVRVLGDKINPNQIIEQVKNEFRSSFKRRLKVIAVNEKSEANKLGIQIGDILYSYNGIAIESNDVLASVMKKYNGQQHILKVIHGNQLLELFVTAGPLGIMAMQTSGEF